MTPTRAVQLQALLDEAYTDIGALDSLTQHHGTEAERLAWHRARVSIAAAALMLSQPDVLPREVPRLEIVKG